MLLVKVAIFQSKKIEVPRPRNCLGPFTNATFEKKKLQWLTATMQEALAEISHPTRCTVRVCKQDVLKKYGAHMQP